MPTPTTSTPRPRKAAATTAQQSGTTAASRRPGKPVTWNANGPKGRDGRRADRPRRIRRLAGYLARPVKGTRRMAKARARIRREYARLGLAR